jgi:DNA replication and repair protein RecF
MSVRGLVLQHFRCHSQSTFNFSPTVTVLVGNNAAGKTSVIEALALLSTGESFRAERDEDMVEFGQEIGRMKTKLDGESGDELEVALTRGFLQGKVVQKKHFVVNGARKRKKDFLGHFTTVVFRPEDMRLVEGSPSRRRQFVDTILATIHPQYAESLSTYEGALKRRNKLIDQVQAGEAPKTVLSYWTSLLLRHGQVVQESRRQFFAECDGIGLPLDMKVEYQPSLVNEERFAMYADKEIAAGHTLIGPHKDDFIVTFLSQTSPTAPNTPDWIDVSQFGSRGQQRLAVLWLKLNELKYVEKHTAVRPLLLLDDILSELDQEHRIQVDHLLQSGQSIVSTTEPAVIEDLKQLIPTLQVVEL